MVSWRNSDGEYLWAKLKSEDSGPGQCDQMMKWNKKLHNFPNIAPKVAKSFLHETSIILNGPKIYHDIWATFVRKFVTKKLRKSPNLVTLAVDVILDWCCKTFCVTYSRKDDKITTCYLHIQYTCIDLTRYCKPVCASLSNWRCSSLLCRKNVDGIKI